MKGEYFYFEETLEEFYKNSNEIEIHTDIFCNKVLPAINIPRDKPLNWLDVGIGKGEKIVNFLECLNTKVNFTFIEPSKYWWKKIDESGNLNIIKNKVHEINKHNTTFENYIQNNENTNFDLISFIQVLYDDNIVDALFHFILNNQNKKPYTIIINLENENNDLYKIRKELQLKGINIPTSKLKKIITFLNKNKISFQRVDSKNKALNLHNSLNDKWLMMFITGIKGINYSLNIDKVNINDTTLIINL